MTVQSRYTRGSANTGGLTRGFYLVLIGWGIAAVLSLMVTFLVAARLGGLFFVVSSLYAAYLALSLLLAKRKAVMTGKEVPILGGLGTLVTWNPTEGVLFLKNKRIDYIDDSPDDGGGIRVYFPILGEEKACSVPLEIQTLPYKDENVLTKEFLPVMVKATIYWKITDLHRFYLSVSKDMYGLTDRGGHSDEVPDSRNEEPQVHMARHWLTAMMEQKTRAILSKVGTGLLISDRLMADLPDAMPDDVTRPLLISGPETSDSYRSATDGIAGAVARTLSDAVSDYGLSVTRVLVQQLDVDAKIYEAAVEACKSAYAPLRAKAEAISAGIKLQAEADVLGADNLAMREIAANVPAMAFADMLGPMFMRFGQQMGRIGTKQ